MRVLLTFLMLVIGSTTAIAEERYNANFTTELKSLGLEREAFLYALNWAGAGDPRAEYDVANSLVNGQGVEANPKAAIALACRSRMMPEYERSRLVMNANLRLADRNSEPIRCD